MPALDRFRREVMSRGPEACLPHNLPDEWLTALAIATDAILFETSPDTKGPGVACVAAEMQEVAVLALVAILSVKHGCAPFEVRLGEIEQHLTEFRLELALEGLQRQTDLAYEPATLDTIFTNRDVRTWSRSRESR
jgi:hypothetical protein